LSYRRRSRPIYNIWHLPSLNLHFRTSWENGLKQALQRLETLKSQGWNVDIHRGTLTEEQAKRYEEAAEMVGYETVRILVAQWGEDTIQFVAYKPKKPVEEAPPPSTRPPAKTRVKKERDPVEAFQKMFWKKQQPGADDMDDGFIMDPHRTMAVVRKDASPVVTGQSIVKMVKEITQNPNLVEELDYSKLVKAEKIGRMTKKPVKHVSFNVHCFSVKKIKQAMRVLSTKKAKAYLQYGKPLIVQDKRGHSVVIAEAIKEPDEPDVVSISTVKAL